MVIKKIWTTVSRERVFNILRMWVPLTVVVTLVIGLAYLMVQRSIRLGANYPQVQIAGDIAGQIKQNGVSPIFMTMSPVEITESLAPYALIYDDSGQLLQTSGLLFGNAPSLPGGILAYTRKNGEDRITWQPRKGVRQALVAVRFSGPHSGFVVSGRSLQETEKLIDNITLVTVTGWVAVIVVGLILISAFQFIL
jgi:hypothetical protein